MAEGRDQALAAVDQPKVLQGTWVRPGGVVVERAFADALGIRVGGTVTLDGKSFPVVGIAVTAAVPVYSQVCFYGGCGGPAGRPKQFDTGLVWLAAGRPRPRQPGQPAHLLPQPPPVRPGGRAAFASRHQPPPASGPAALTSWQSLSAAASTLVSQEQNVLSPASWLLGLLALATVAVVAGARMTEQERRVGLLKAAGATPSLAAVILLAEHLIIAIGAAAVGLAVGWLVAPLLTSPGASLVGAAGRARPHAVNRPARGGRRSGRRDRLDARPRHPRRADEHRAPADRSSAVPAPPGMADQALVRAAGPAPPRPAPRRPLASSHPAQRSQLHRHQRHHRGRAHLPRHGPRRRPRGRTLLRSGRSRPSASRPGSSRCHRHHGRPGRRQRSVHHLGNHSSTHGASRPSPVPWAPRHVRPPAACWSPSSCPPSAGGLLGITRSIALYGAVRREDHKRAFHWRGSSSWCSECSPLSPLSPPFPPAPAHASRSPLSSSPRHHEAEFRGCGPGDDVRPEARSIRD